MHVNKEEEKENMKHRLMGLCVLIQCNRLHCSNNRNIHLLKNTISRHQCANRTLLRTRNHGNILLSTAPPPPHTHTRQSMPHRCAYIPIIYWMLHLSCVMLSRQHLFISLRLLCLNRTIKDTAENLSSRIRGHFIQQLKQGVQKRHL